MMDQLPSCQKVNIETVELISTLEFYGTELETPEYFTNLSIALANVYYNFFSKEKIESLYEQLLSLENTKLNLTTYFNDPTLLTYLQFNETIKYQVNENTYIIFALNGVVKEFAINDEKQPILNLDILHAIQILEFKKLVIDDSKLIKELQKLALTSHIYSYAYHELEKIKIDKMDIIRAGMFKNAYYNIIALKGQSYLKQLIEMPIKVRIRQFQSSIFTIFLIFVTINLTL